MSRAHHLCTPIAAGALLVLVSSVLFPTGAWAQVLRGTVTDEEGSPLADVEITVTSQQLSSFRKSLVTDQDGNFRLRFLRNQLQYRFELLLEKTGYRKLLQELTPSGIQEMKETFVLEPSAATSAESHGELTSVLSGDANTAIAAFNEGLSAQRSGQLEAARAKLEEAVVADPALGPAHVALAQVRLDLGELEAAIAAADRALELEASRAEALKVKHQALRSLGRKAEAEAVAEELEEADDAVAAARMVYNEGAEAFQAGDRDTALERFRQAAELDPSLIDAHHAVSTLELAVGNHQAAAEAAERALELGSGDVRTLRVLYDAYDALGLSERLAEIAPRLAEVDPEFGGSKLLEQAAALWNVGQSERAVALARLALSLDPGDPALAKAYYFIGLHHIASGKNAEAKAALQKFVELAPDDPEAATAEEMISFLEQE